MLEANGITLDRRSVATSPTLRRSTRTGTREMNTLIVGRAVSGFGAFV
jgi:hypothetical protein